MADPAFDDLAEKFDYCLGMSPEIRESWLRRLESDNPVFARELRGLIQAHESADDMLEESAVSLMRKDAPALPERVGKYRIVGELGRGGMGVVYLGLHEGDGFVQEVAIKVIKRGLDTDEIVRRFKQERRILGQLAHEQIAKLLDGGATPEGLPFLVMERVRGDRIDRWCSQRNLTVEQRIRVFRKVCEAVSHAHRQLVVHRDLKPSNVLVTEDGIPKLLDFGVAKVLANDDPEATLTSSLPHTPEYASPEQAAGGAVSTLTDVYSLGMILYELLAGARPQGKRTPPLGPEIQKRGMRLPSGASQTDLDRVVLKALQKDPGARYQSVDQFSDDLGRWLRREPVQARPATLMYLASRFVIRHKTGLGVAAVLLLGLSITTGWALHQTSVARQERLRADQRFRETRELANTLLFGVYDQVSQLQGSIPVRETIVRESLRYLDSLSKDAGGDLRFRYELASGYRRLAGLQGEPMMANKGDSNAAMASLDKAIRLQESIVAATPQQTQASQFLSSLYDDRARLLNAAGKPEPARESAARALEISERIAAAEPTQANRLHLATELMHASSFNFSPATMAKGVAQQERSVALFDELAAGGFSTLQFRIQHAFAHNRMGAIATAFRHDDATAARHYVEALGIEQELVKEHPERADLQYNLTFTENDLAGIREREGRLDEALAGYRRVLAIRETLANADPGDVRAQHGIASACMGLSSAMRQMKGFPEALQYAERAVTIEDRLAGENRTRSLDLARAWWTMANVYLGWAKARPEGSSGRLALASRYYRMAQPVYAGLLKEGRLPGAFANSNQELNALIAETEALRRR